MEGFIIDFKIRCLKLVDLERWCFVVEGFFCKVFMIDVFLFFVFL